MDEYSEEIQGKKSVWTVMGRSLATKTLTLTWLSMTPQRTSKSRTGSLMLMRKLSMTSLTTGMTLRLSFRWIEFEFGANVCISQRCAVLDSQCAKADRIRRAWCQCSMILTNGKELTEQTRNETIALTDLERLRGPQSRRK